MWKANCTVMNSAPKSRCAEGLVPGVMLLDDGGTIRR